MELGIIRKNSDCRTDIQDFDHGWSLFGRKSCSLEQSAVSIAHAEEEILCSTTLVLGESLPRPMLQKKLHHAVPHIAVEHTDLQGSRWHSSYHRQKTCRFRRSLSLIYFLWSPVVTFHHPKCWQGTNLLKHHPNFWHPVGEGLTLGTNSSSLGHNFLSFTLGINENTLGTDGITLGINRMTLGINGVSLGLLWFF